MRKQGKKVSQTNPHGISIEPSYNMKEEMSEREFIMYIIKMILEANHKIREQMQAMNDCTNKQLKEQLQEANDHFNKKIDSENKPNRNL